MPWKFTERIKKKQIIKYVYKTVGSGTEYLLILFSHTALAFRQMTNDSVSMSLTLGK